MQQPISVTIFVLIGITIYISYLGFKNRAFFDRYKFDIGAVLRKREYYRLISSAFLHADVPHLIFNTFCFYSFAEELELIFGKVLVLGIYFLSMLAGNLLSLLIHRNHYDYSAVGASGAVSGIIFASIFLLPGSSIMFFLIPIAIPASLFAVFYTVISIYGIRSQRDNIGHEAHLGGAVTGMLFTAIMYPEAIVQSSLLFAVIMALIAGFLLYSIKNPLILPNKGFLYTRQNPDSLNSEIQQRNQMRQELDKLLEKVNQKGLHALSKKEKKKLDSITNSLQEDS